MEEILYVGSSYCCDRAVKGQGPKSMLRSKNKLWLDTRKEADLSPLTTINKFPIM